jgi:hypothetical protein
VDDRIAKLEALAAAVRRAGFFTDAEREPGRPAFYCRCVGLCGRPAGSHHIVLGVIPAEADVDAEEAVSAFREVEAALRALDG